MKMKFKIGTDCSGIGSPEMAIKNLGIDFEHVMACDVDKYAKQSYFAMHGEPNMWFDDLTKREHEIVPQLDLYVAGFPCQSFSMAGKRKGFDDIRGSVFFHVAEFIRINQPKMFVLENVKGLLSHDSGRTFQTIIDVLSGNGTCNEQHSIPFYDDGLEYHVHYKVLNTKEHGIPQNRERVFIVGFREPKQYTFPSVEPLKLKLKDVLENNVDEKYYLSEKMLNHLIKHPRSQEFINKQTESVNCITANYCKQSSDLQYLKVKSATSIGYEIATENDSINFSNIDSKTRRGRVGKEVAQTLDTACNQAVIGAMRGRNVENLKSRKVGLETMQHLEINENGTSNCLTTIQKDNLVVTDKIRRLTPLECFRLQGFSDESFFKAKSVCSDTQLYRQAGNSITVNVIQKVIKNMI